MLLKSIFIKKTLLNLKVILNYGQTSFPATFPSYFTIEFFFLRIGHIIIICDDFFNESKEKVDDKLLRPQYMWGRRMIMFYCNVL